MERTEWKISVPIFKNALILKQLGIAIGIPFGIVALIVGIASGKTVYLLYGLGLIAGLLLLSWLLIMALYRGNYEVEFVLNGEGALCRTQAKQAKKNWVVNASMVDRLVERDDISVIAITANEIAEEIGSSRYVNMDMVGAQLGSLGLLPPEAIEAELEAHMSKRR